MTSNDVLLLWKKISSIISDEILNNAEFAKKMSEVSLENASVVATKKTSRRLPAKIDPFTLLEQGEDELSKGLAELSIDELKDVISQNGMDTSKLAMKWKKRERLEKLIIDATKRKSTHGESFWNALNKNTNNNEG